jgi:D-alanyl-D-alanine carboxypeptidase (penicillin-binding protein 5/6)
MPAPWGIRGPLAALAMLLATAAGAPVARATTPPPAISAPAAIVIDARTGERLYAKDADDRRAIASTTKLMTAAVALTRAKPSQVFVMPPYPVTPGESKLGLATGERMTFHDLLRAMMLPSANDAAYDVAVNVGGSKDGFVRLMNQRARALGLSETHYSTPVGLDDPANYSSARDLAELTALLLRNRTFARIVDMPSATLESGSHPRTIVNRNDLVLDYPFVDGVKTGHTIDAGFVLVGSASGNGAKVVSVVLGTPSIASRDADSIALLRWGVQQYHPVRAVAAGTRFARATVRYRDDDEVGLVAGSGARLTVRRGARVSRRIDAPDELKGPLPRGARVGTVSVVYRGRVVKRVPLVTAAPVEGAGWLRRFTSSVGGPAAALALLALLGVAALLVALRVRATRGMRGERAAR